MVGIIENWTFGGPLASSSDKFGNTIVYYTTHCPLGGPRPPGPLDLLRVIWYIVNSFICK